jgi:acyl-CoA synthetase (AMP-forming)/AMP-acid ligase II
LSDARDPVSEASDLQTLPALLDAVAARYPTNEAFIGTRRRATYAELRHDSIAIARGLAVRGVGRGTRVGLLMPNRPEWITTVFGVWRCGGILVPVSALAPPRELGHYLRSADVRLLVAVRRFLRHDYVAALDHVAPGAGGATSQAFDPALPALRQVIWMDDDPGSIAIYARDPEEALRTVNPKPDAQKRQIVSAAMSAPSNPSARPCAAASTV